MVIHHDKMAYGKVDGLKDSLSEDKLKAMAAKLSAAKAEDFSEETEQTESAAERDKNKK